MTNGEKIKEIFPNGIYPSSGTWMCMEYKESTTKNDLAVDLISRADVNQVIEDYMDEQYHVLSDRTRERAFGANAVKARINELPSVTPQEPRWIPVSERLPENKETVIVTFKHFVSGNTIGLGSMILLRGKPHWHVREQNLGAYDVLAWMPLPKAYREVKE